MYKIIDFVSKKEVTPDGLVFAGEDTPWEVQMDIEKIRKKINLDYFTTATPCLSKYLPFMPIKEPANFISLREAATPLLKSKRLGADLNLDLYFKVEGKNPTGSFKDRGSAVDITVAKELKAKGIILASTGNMAASCSCYAAAAKIPCFIVVPEGVPMSKLAQVISFGGRIVQVKGSYNDAAELAYKVAKSQGFFLAGDYAFRVEGAKTAAFEMIDQLLFQVPDMVVVPIGCGTNIAAYAKGFHEYKQLDLIDKTPVLVGVQATGADAVVQSYNDKSTTINALDGCSTIATAIAVPDPIDGVKALDAIYHSEGEAISVSDTEMLEAQYLLATHEGLFVETSSAATLAYLLKKNKQDASLKGKRIVCVLSGDGLKDPGAVIKAAVKPPTIYPEEKEFLKLYNSKFFENKTMIFFEKDKVIFDTVPSDENLKKELKTLFGEHYDDKYIDKIKQIIASILHKGKRITISDFQDIVQDARESINDDRHEVFKVKNFKVEASQDEMSQAKVIVVIDDKEYQASSDGTGPVDAVISALCKASHDKISFKLTDYKVIIRSEGINAVVYVEMTLVKDGFSSIGRAASPDIIQASVEAFADAYNACI